MQCNKNRSILSLKKTLFIIESKTNKRSYSVQVGIESSALLQLENEYNRNTTLHTVLQLISAVNEMQSNDCSPNVIMEIKLPSLFPPTYPDHIICML